MDKILIDVINVVGQEMCIDSEDGDKLFKLIKNAIDNKKEVVLSFLNIRMLTTAFLNTAIGKLYGLSNAADIPKYLSVDNISDDDRMKIKMVTDRAKQYYKDKPSFDKIVQEELGD